MSEYMSPFAIFVVSVVGAGIGAYIGAYLREKGRNLATHEDIDRIVAQLRKTTEATEDIKAQISGELWVKQRRWDVKWDCYAEIVENLGELHTLISEVIALQNRGPGQDAAAVEREVADGLSRAEAAMQKARRSGSKARLAVAPKVRTFLTTFGDKWNAARGPVEQGTIARDAGIEIADIGRNDLFGDPRDVSALSTENPR
jgi:hypothetical protein